MFGNIPPFARAWLASIAVVSVATSNGIIDPLKVVFIPSKVADEPWRLVLLFCYFGPVSLALVQNLLLISRSASSLEGAYIYNTGMMPKTLTERLEEPQRDQLRQLVEDNRTIDFAYLAIQMAASIVVASSAMYVLLGFSGTSLIFLGPILERSLLYIWCKNAPEAEQVVLGFPIRAKYALWLTQVLYGLLSEDFIPVTKAFRYGFMYGLRQLLTCEFIVELVVVFLVAHFWWYTRFFLLDDLYNETKTNTRKSATEAYAKVWPAGVSSLLKVGLPRLLQKLVTPPWYFVVCTRLYAQQTAAAAVEVDVEDVTDNAEVAEN